MHTVPCHWQKRIDDDRPVLDDPSIWVIHIQAVPAIILNKDQHYVADPNAKPWDPTSMIDEIYAADDAGQRKTRDQLEKLPKTDVDISYEYQAPGAATAAAADKVDLTKAGVYTVTYSHTYADGRVVKDSRKVYVDDDKQETKDITRTIIVHAPNGTDQTVTQTATLTREVKRDATTGKSHLRVNGLLLSGKHTQLQNLMVTLQTQLKLMKLL